MLSVANKPVDIDTELKSSSWHRSVRQCVSVLQCVLKLQCVLGLNYSTRFACLLFRGSIS